MDAIALGKINTEIQNKLVIIDGEIAKIKSEIDEPSDKTENLYTKVKNATEFYKKQEKRIDDFLKKSATGIKNLTSPQIAKTSYDKNNFGSEMENAKLLSELEIEKYKETIKSEMKKNIESIVFPNFDLSDRLKSANEILQSSVSQQQLIDELKDNPEKQNFAKKGMEIHKHGEKCSFCGNDISEPRWQLLGAYFNDEVKKLEKRIKENIEKIENEIITINTLKEINKSDFYKKFADQIEKLNLQIKNTKNERIKFLENLKISLEDKLNNLFAKSKSITIDIPANFDKTKKDYDKIIKENNDFSQNLTAEQDKAKSALRCHEVKKALDAFKYETENASLENLRMQKTDAEKRLSEKQAEFSQKIETKNELISQTKDEEQIAKQVNKLLRNMGVASFSLELVTDANEKQKGQYQIKGHNGNIRSITELSKGEKNIIAFLYFLFSLQEISNDNRPRIIVLDDPMTSNDDTMQYLMIGEIQKFYRALDDKNTFILFTHNCHFYLNVRPNTSQQYKVNGIDISFYEKYGNYHLYSDGKYTTVRAIKKGNQDFKTNYDILWKELSFLYNSTDATSDLMLNPCRKICETYMHFTKKNIDVFYGENINAKNFLM